LQALNLATPLGWIKWVLPLLFAGELVLALSARKGYHKPANGIRAGLLLAGMASGVALLLFPVLATIMPIPLFLISIIEEIVGRWLFYEMLKERPL